MRDVDIDPLVARWRGVRGVVPTSDDARVLGRLLERYGAAALEEILCNLETAGVLGIRQPLQYLAGGLRRWEGERHAQDRESRAAADATTQTKQHLDDEDRRKREHVGLTPPQQFSMMRQLWAAAQEMAAAGVSRDEKARILEAMASDAIGLPEAAPFLPVTGNAIERGEQG